MSLRVYIFLWEYNFNLDECQEVRLWDHETVRSCSTHEVSPNPVPRSFPASGANRFQFLHILILIFLIKLLLAVER